MLVQVGQHPSTGPPTYQIIKVPNANHMNVMKTSLTIIPTCPRERFALYKSSSRLILCYKKDWATLLHLCYKKNWATLLHLCYTCYLLPVTNYLITKLSVTDNFSACREYLTENRFSFFCSSLGLTLLLIERTTIDPLYLWVIKGHMLNGVIIMITGAMKVNKVQQDGPIIFVAKDKPGQTLI